jgi:hypothetical protein
MYSISNFLKPLGVGERSVQIQDPNFNLIWTLNPFTIRNTFITGNLIEISLYSGNKIVLDFSTTNESKQALSLLQGRIDVLRNQTPIYIDKAIEEYVNNISASGILYDPSGTLTASNVQDALDQVEYQINSISASATGYFLPADPTTTTSTAGVMMGLGSTVSFTPTRTGKIMIILSGDTDNATNGCGVNIQMRYGTGAAPANGAALTGTTVGTLIRMVNQNSNEIFPFTLNGIVSGLSVSTAIWVDISLASTGAGTNTARVRDIMVTIIEI